MAARKYNYFIVATPIVAETFNDYHDALKFYGNSESPSTLYGIKEDEGWGDEHVTIKSK